MKPLKFVIPLGGDCNVYREVDGKQVALTPQQLEQWAMELGFRANDLRERQAMESIQAGQLYQYLCDEPFYVLAQFDAKEGMVFLPADKYGNVTGKKPVLVFPYANLVRVKSQGKLAKAAAFLGTELVPAF
ncbi:hypothetical protein [Noviherbaspirillum galbum]|uniref:Uncharacterized protein n=1 Tax=Noviherbaspirillum galbum TaxID=2709383 RepID=A0A6B3SGZ0_9BURK|nr:hypothetical protein [Noviherbaspirillum galbum]NEX60124.1 hypothetical protein [Noviherbaspirillum galbum]